MKIKLSSLIASVLLLAASASAATFSQATFDNLNAAFNAESNAHNRYLAFAQKADIEGYSQVAKRSIELSKDDGLHVSSDPRYLRQMLHSLLTNAMRHGSGPIRVVVGRVERATLCTISNEVSADAPPERGTGIGLRVTRALASALGCTLSLESKDGRFVAELAWSAESDTTRE